LLSITIKKGVNAMNKRIFLAAISILLFTSTSQVITKSITKKISSTAKKTGKSVQKAGKKVLDQATSAANAIVKNAQNILLGEPKPQFCAIDSSRVYAPTIEDKEVIEQDEEDMIPTIKKYSPVIYLCKERYYPVAAEDYFLAPDTQLVYQANQRDPQSPKEIVIPKGQVTMEKIYENRNKYKDKKDFKQGSYFFEIGKCTEFGSNPKQFSDKNGNLTTPIYASWNESGDKIYIVYTFAYAFNGAYPVYAPGIHVPVLKGDLMREQGAHEFDLEHITLELNKNKELERIYLAAHTREEGLWLPAHHKDLEYEGTHPIIHAATNGHGSYPREGTYVRIYGFGNDITCKSEKWVPQIVLMYPETDKRFNPKTMGWAYHSGVYGRRGVKPLSRFFDGARDLPFGQPYENVQFCPNPKKPKNALDFQKTKYSYCIESKRKNAKIPGKKNPKEQAETEKSLGLDQGK